MQEDSGVRLFSGAAPADVLCVHVHECTPAVPAGRSVEALGRLSRAEPDPTRAGNVQSSVLFCSYCEDLFSNTVVHSDILEHHACMHACMHAAAPRVA